MLETITENKKEFTVLGQQVKLSENSTESDRILALKALEVVREKALELKSKNPRMDDRELAVIIALTLASEKNKMQEVIRSDMAQYVTEVSSILAELNEIYPKTRKTH